MDPIQLTKDLVSINSANPFSTVSINGKEYGIGNEEKINDYLESLLIQHGFDVHKQVYQEEMRVPQPDGTTTIIPKRWNVLAQKGNAKKSILFLGHTDTVDVKEGWECDPFIGEERVVDGEKRFYGLGSNDMKAGLAAIVAATACINPENYNIKIAFVTDEEYWSYGAQALCESDFLQDVVFAVVPEMLENAHPDPETTWFGLGRLGRAEYIVHVGGVSCHGADAFISQEAINAVHESVKIQTELIKFFDASKAVFQTDKVRVHNSAYISLHEGGKGILSVPDAASFIIDRCLIPGEDVQGEKRKIIYAIEQMRVDGIFHPRVAIRVEYRQRPTPPCEPYIIEEETVLSQFIREEVLRVEKKIAYTIGRSVADENRLSHMGIPTYIIPPRGEHCHTSREWVDLRSIEKVALILKNIIKNSNLLDLVREDTFKNQC